jgi:uncharacterized membrane protein YbhN (UPF0104 family)
MPSIKTLIKRIKPYIRWFVLALTFGFIFHTLRENWQQVLTIRFTPFAFAKLTMALGVTLLAHIWSGWIWCWILQLLNSPIALAWAVIVYLKTNLGKYLPGNVWHFVWRVHSLRNSATPTGVAITGVVLEPILMAVAALAIAIVILPSTLLQSFILVGLLAILHPRILNPILKRLASTRIKQADDAGPTVIPELKAYPLRPFIGEIIFVLLRGLGFLLCFLALDAATIQNVWTIIGVFSFAWLLGLIVPGAPGGLGVFEATALTLLTPSFSAAVVLGAVALYRLNSTLAEVLGAGLAVLDEQWNLSIKKLTAHPETSKIILASKVSSEEL